MPELGRAALVATLGLVLYALVAGGYAAWKRKRRLALSAQNALLAAFGTTLVASLVLVAALIRHDFSFVYVADHTSRELPTGYTISAFWGGQEGSLLLWLLLLTGYSAAAVLLEPAERPVTSSSGSYPCSALSRSSSRSSSSWSRRRSPPRSPRPTAPASIRASRTRT